jgi:hypothetical protein
MSDVALLNCGPQSGSSRCCFFDNGQSSIINSIVYGIRTLPEAKIGPVKRMPKCGMGSCRLHALTFNYTDQLFIQSISSPISL